MDTEDARLVADAVAGDRAAFAALVTRHYDRIFRVAWRILGNRAEAEDLAQDVCATLGRRIRSFRGEAAFTTWLHRLVVNAARDRLRREAARPGGFETPRRGGAARGRPRDDLGNGAAA